MHLHGRYCSMCIMFWFYFFECIWIVGDLCVIFLWINLHVGRYSYRFLIRRSSLNAFSVVGNGLECILVEKVSSTGWLLQAGRRWSCTGSLRTQPTSALPESPFPRTLHSSARSLVSRGTCVLAEFTTTSGNFTTVTRSILSKLPNKDTRMSYVYDRFGVIPAHVKCDLSTRCCASQPPLPLHHQERSGVPMHGWGKLWKTNTFHVSRRYYGKVDRNLWRPWYYRSCVWYEWGLRSRPSKAGVLKAVTLCLLLSV